MKKLNKKGFTMIELLAVLVILVVIMAIAIPSVTSSIERSKQKEKDQKIKLIESAAELYIDRYNCPNDGTVSIELLINNSSLRASEIIDPDNSDSTICGYFDCGESKFIEDNTNDNYCIKIE